MRFRTDRPSSRVRTRGGPTIPSPRCRAAQRRGPTIRSGVLLALLALLGVLPTFLSAQPRTGLPEAAPGPGASYPAADSLLATHDRVDGPGVLVALVRDGGVAWAGAAGLAHVGHRVPMTRETRINVGSTAKTMTGYALARLSLDGVLSLDDDVRTHLPELPDLGTPVTLRHLLTHTSGYREFLNALAVAGWRVEEADHIAPDEALRVVQRQPALQNEPGGERNYNNTGYVLLAQVVERATGVPFPKWMEGEVFEPLGMHATGYRVDPAGVVPGAAYGYLPGPDPGVGGSAWREGRDVGAAVGAGALYTTLDDLATWMLALTGDDPRWAEPFRLMTEPFVLNDGTPTNYGLGIEMDRSQGLRRIHHPGGDIGHQSHFAWFPEVGAGVIVVSNRGDFPGAAAAAFVRAFLDEHMTPPTPTAGPVADAPEPAAGGVRFPDRLLARLEGRYALEVQPGFVLRIWQEDGSLLAQATGQPSFRMTATADTAFHIEAVGARLEFRLDGPDGDAPSPGLTLHQGGEELAATRVGDDSEGPELDEYSGTYYSTELGTHYTVGVEGGALRFEHRRRSPVRLVHAGGERFTGAFPLVRVEFERDASGAVTGFRVDAVRARDMHFERIP